jgi:TonB family protein
MVRGSAHHFEAPNRDTQNRENGSRHGALAWVLSLVVHASLSLVGVGTIERAGAFAPRLAARPVDPGAAIDVDVALPAYQVSEPAAEPDAPSGTAGVARPDSGRRGRGGDDDVGDPAVNLAARDDEAHLVPALQSRFDRAQETRRRSTRERRSPEDDRVALEPMLLTFVSDGDLGQRRAAAGRRGSVGEDGALGPRAERPRGDDAMAKVARGAAGPRALGAASTTQARRPGTTARPHTLAGGESSPADDRGKAADNVDSEQEVMTREPALLRASTAGGRAGVGSGGESGGGKATGAGGQSGPGSVARPHGAGGSSLGDGSDERRRHYLRHMWLKIHGSWSARDFPKEAALQGKQGYTVVGFVVKSDGSVSGVRVVRPSGVPEFDARMVRAVLRAAPFGALPTELGRELHHRHEFVISNPAVRPPANPHRQTP